MATDNLDSSSVRLSEWPPQSPDMNPIENVWKIIKEELHKTQRDVNNRADLIDEVTRIWSNISTETVQCLYESIPRRLKAVKNMKGQMTKY